MRRTYPQVGKVDSLNDVQEIIDAIEKDNISRDKKRRRLQFQYSLLHSKGKLGLKAQDVPEAKRMFKAAYQKYMKPKDNLGHGPKL